jgi:hypothetical protein
VILRAANTTIRQSAFSIAGGMGNSTLWRLDGADNGDYMAGGNLAFPFPDAVGQTTQESSTLGAQDGMKAGGMVNVVTKSGTNQFHGDAFEYIRNDLIDASSFYSGIPMTGCIRTNTEERSGVRCGYRRCTTARTGSSSLRDFNA